MEQVGEIVLGILQIVGSIALAIGILWWLWHGLAGTWYLIKYFLHKHPWINTTLVVIVGLVFGWNVLLIILAVLICLGPITKSWSRHLWKNELLKIKRS